MMIIEVCFKTTPHGFAVQEAAPMIGFAQRSGKTKMTRTWQNQMSQYNECVPRMGVQRLTQREIERKWFSLTGVKSNA